MHDSRTTDKRSSAPPCILFLDDEERILRTLRSLFSAKYDVVTTTDGQFALQTLKQRHVHLVVSDQRMPRMTGVEFLRMAKEVSPNTMRILLTGFSDLNAVIGSINNGEVFRFINKPWDSDGIQRTVAEAVEIGERLAGMMQPMTGNAVERERPMSQAIMTVSRFKPLYLEVTELVRGRCEVHHARCLRDAVMTLQVKDIAVIIAESDPENADVGLFLKLLKKEYPEIVTVLVTPTADIEAAINLINQAQLFRFLPMPVSVAVLKANVEAALQHAQLLKAKPTILERHTVEAAGEDKQSPAAESLLRGLRALALRSDGGQE